MVKDGFTFQLNIFRVDVDPEALRWTPVPCVAVSLNGSPAKKEAGLATSIAKSNSTTLPEERSVENTLEKEKETLSESSGDEELDILKKQTHTKNNNEKIKVIGKKLKKNKIGPIKKVTDLSSSEEDDEEEKIVRKRKRFGQKTSTVALTTVAACQPSNGNIKGKRSGESKGKDGGEKSNILSTTITTSRHHNNKDVAKVCSGKAKLAADINSSEKANNKKGILNRAISRLLDLEQSNQDSLKSDYQGDNEKLSTIRKSKANLSLKSKTKTRSPNLTNQGMKKANDRKNKGRINSATSSTSTSDNSPKTKAAAGNSVESDTSDIEDENKTLASKIKKGNKRNLALVDKKDVCTKRKREAKIEQGSKKKTSNPGN
jgi:hypothetical protein